MSTNFFSRNNTVQSCPNCWGTQEWNNCYQSKAISLDKDRSIVGKARKAFILKFVEKYLPKWK